MSISKTMVLGSVILVSSAFVLIRNHSITALIVGVIGIAVLIAGATKKQQVYRAATLPTMTLCKKCGAKCESDWHYCAACATLLSQKDHVCPHCGMNTEKDWSFCPHCTKKLM